MFRINMISSQVLADWNSGKIKYCTHPPEEEKQTSSEIVTQFASEFSLIELERGEKMDLQKMLPCIVVFSFGIQLSP